MNREELQEKLLTSNGILELYGFPMDRSIKIFGEVLDIEESRKVANFATSGFDWGYTGSGPKQLAFAILYAIRPELAERVTEEFMQCIIQFLPHDKFKVYIDIIGFLNLVENPQSDDTGKSRSALQFMKVDYNGLQVPKSLDVVNLPFSSFSYGSLSWEFDWLENLSKEDRDIYFNYIWSNSRRYDHTKPNNEIKIEYEKSYSGYMFKNGLGSGCFLGHNKNEYHQVT